MDREQAPGLARVSRVGARGKVEAVLGRMARANCQDAGRRCP